MLEAIKKNLPQLTGGMVVLSLFTLLAYAAVFFAPSSQPIGYIGQPAMSSYDVRSGNALIYRGMYNNVDWSGRFECYAVTATGYINLSSPCFVAGAGSPLDVQAAANTRLIGTLSDASSPEGIEFSTTALTATQQTALGGAANVNWLRGTSLSPAGLRARSTVLGDIIHSRPYYWADSASPTVFVGANDGMLHAFNATTGAENWAYVPSMLLAKMAKLTSAAYSHDYYVDGGIAIAKAGTTPVLVGALGAGGRGLYALNLTSLTATNGAAAGAKALWEITNSSIKCPASTAGCTSSTSTTAYANLGYTYSNPVIVPTQDGNTSVIAGNGYNNTGNGHATLYVLNVLTGAVLKEIDTGSGSTTSPNGLSSVTVIDSNGDGMADRVYAGDINGNMWVFDLSSASPGSWTAHLLYSVPQGSAAEPIAITIAPAVTTHPNGGYMVNFATGRILSVAGAAALSPSSSGAIDDTADISTPYAVYGVWDNLTAGAVTTSNLFTQTIAPSTYTAGSTTISVVHCTTDNKPDWSSNRGWVVNLSGLAAGARVTGDSVFVDNGKFHFNVTNPTVSFTPSGSSVVSSGVNYLLELDYLSGGAGLSPFLDLNGDGLLDKLDLLTSSGSTTLAASLIPVGYLTSTGVQSQPILIQLANSRVPVYNQNYYASMAGQATGVNGGHFDVDTFYYSGAQCTGGTLSAAGTACTGVCTGGTLNSTQTGCTTVPSGTYVAATVGSCPGGTLAGSGTACAAVGTWSAATCGMGTISGTSCKTSVLTQSCTNGGAVISGTATCTQSTWVSGTNGSCSNGGTVNSTNNGCVTATYTAAAAAKCTNGGTVSGTSCIAPTSTYTAPSCTNGVLNSGKTACTATSFTPASCTNGGTLSSNNTVCTPVSLLTPASCAGESTVLNSTNDGCKSSLSVFTAASCSNGGSLTSNNTACSPQATTITLAKCSNGTLNTSNSACLATTYVAAKCSNSGTVSGTSCIAPTSTYTAGTSASCSNGGTVSGTSCTQPTFTYGTAYCSNNGTKVGYVNPCPTPVYTHSCSNGGTFVSSPTSCTTPAYTAAKCTGGTLTSDGTQCTAPGIFTAGAAASCTGGVLNASSTACTTITPGTYSAIGNYVVNGSAGFKPLHYHNYDKIYDVNGLNILNPNVTTFSLANAPGMLATTAYKVLVMNQGWNRAMNLRIGTWSGSARDYQTMLSTDVISNYVSANCTAANSGIGCLDVINLPVFTGISSQVGHLSGSAVVVTAGTDYTTVASTSTTDVAGKVNVLNVVTTGTIGCRSGASSALPSGCTASSQTSGARSSVGGLEMSMPGNGYNIQDWWKDGDGVVSTGVMPTNYACAYGVNSNGTMPSNSGANYYTGPNGERHDGVLTIQIIDPNTPDSDVQMNVPGQAIYGFRVIDAKITQDVIAEYTLYWHHPNVECMGAGASYPWSAYNVEGDPWWPVEETVTTTGSNPFVSSTANNTSTAMGDLTCVAGVADSFSPSDYPAYASGSHPQWNTTASPTAYTAATTSPYSGALSSSNGPAGWTIRPPQDSATTLPICPTYNQLYDDPRTSSFINPVAGQNGSSISTGSTTSSSYLSSGLGGRPAAGSSAAGGSTTGGSTTSSASGVTFQQQGAPLRSRRINWRELIGL